MTNQELISRELEILWSDFDENDVDQKLEAFFRLSEAVIRNDLSQLVEALKSEKNDFWTRELLSEWVAALGGLQFLPELLDAAQLNIEEGHDNDSLNMFLVEIVKADPLAGRNLLLELLANEYFPHWERANWLLSFCDLEE